MVYCPYCGQLATVEIPSIPSHVCLTHAIDFWNGLLAFARERSTSGEPREPPCGFADKPIRLTS